MSAMALFENFSADHLATPINGALILPTELGPEGVLSLHPAPDQIATPLPRGELSRMREVGAARHLEALVDVDLQSSVARDCRSSSACAAGVRRVDSSNSRCSLVVLGTTCTAMAKRKGAMTTTSRLRTRRVLGRYGKLRFVSPSTAFGPVPKRPLGLSTAWHELARPHWGVMGLSPLNLGQGFPWQSPPGIVA